MVTMRKPIFASDCDADNRWGTSSARAVNSELDVATFTVNIAHCTYPTSITNDCLSSYSATPLRIFGIHLSCHGCWIHSGQHAWLDRLHKVILTKNDFQMVQVIDRPNAISALHIAICFYMVEKFVQLSDLCQMVVHYLGVIEMIPFAPR